VLLKELVAGAVNSHAGSSAKAATGNIEPAKRAKAKAKEVFLIVVDLQFQFLGTALVAGVI
jgi:hypothetical protein